jgi:hypothetical protein
MIDSDDELGRQRRSAAALRVRRHRQRRRRGSVWLACTLRRSTVEALIRYGWLHSGQQDDRGAVAAAFLGFASRAVAYARHEGPDLWYLR